MRFSIPLLALFLAACSTPADEPAPIVINTMDDEVVEEIDVPEIEEPEIAAMPEFVGTPVLEDINPAADIVEVEMFAEIRTVEMADGLEFRTYMYNGSLPGPLLEATVGDTVIVHFTNRLTEPTTIHWHGLRISDEMDGNPRIQAPVEPGETFTYEFVVEDAGTFWYHPHVRTNIQVERGLYGPLVVHEKPEDRPRHDRERFFVLDDLLIDGDKIAGPFAGHMEAMHGRNGNALVTNGSLDGVTGAAKVGERERWRLVNTANARTMEVTIEGARFVVYGNDGGRVEPYETDELLLPVGQRYDVEVIYDAPGQATLQQLVLTRNSSGQVVRDAFVVATIDVEASDEEPTQVEWAAPPVWEDRPVDRNETVVLDAAESSAGGIVWRINGEGHSMEPMYEFAKGETVKMEIRNMLGPEHPFHLHGQFFKVEGLPGVWDTVLIPGQSTVEITAYMDNPGEWMMHCHILEHAELGMMTSFVVTE